MTPKLEHATHDVGHLDESHQLPAFAHTHQKTQVDWALQTLGKGQE